MRKPGWIVGRPVLLLIASLHGALTIGAENDNRTPVPDAASVEASEKLVRDVFGEKHRAARSTADKVALAKKILAAATESTNAPAEQFVLFRVARDIATSAADAETALKAVERISQHFRVDSLQMQVAVLQEVSGRARLPSDHKALLPHLGAVFDEAMASERFDVARQVQKLSMASAVKTRHAATQKQASAWLKQLDRLEKEFAAVRQALAVLDERATDPVANLVVGRYRCFSKGDWEAGLPMLALGSDPALSGLAEQELVAPESADGQAELADAWWKYAETAEGPAKAATQIRAGRWYREALPRLAGLSKVKAERRLQGLAKLGVSERQLIHQQTSPRKYEPVNLLALIDLAQDHYSIEKWSFVDGSLVAVKQGRHPRFKVPYIPPEEYDLELEVTRLAPLNKGPGRPLWVGLAGGGRRFHLVLDHDYPLRTKLCNFSKQGLASNRNPTQVNTVALLTGQRTKILCQIREQSVKVVVGGRTLIDWRGGFERFSPDRLFAAPKGLPLCVGRGSHTGMAVHSITLTPISGPGRPLREGN
jgi:hypothetical protein